MILVLILKNNFKLFSLVAIVISIAANSYFIFIEVPVNIIVRPTGIIFYSFVNVAAVIDFSIVVFSWNYIFQLQEL